MFRMHAELEHKTWIVTVLSFVFILVVNEGSTNGNIYHKTSNLCLRFHAPVQNWTRTTAIQCARRCNVADSCRSFTWDSADDTCTIGGCAMATGGMRAANESEKLYVRQGKCRYDLGYELRCLDTTVRCLYLSSEKVPYEEARLMCNGLQGRLCKANTVELIELILGLALERNARGKIFIGLTDIDNEDTFVWVDGQTMKPDERKQLFRRGQPDNDRDEDCAEINVNRKRLNDYGCGKSLYFVCEMNIDY